MISDCWVKVKGQRFARKGDGEDKSALIKAIRAGRAGDRISINLQRDAAEERMGAVLLLHVHGNIYTFYLQ